MSEYHHLCLVSDQLVPNYRPVLEKELRASQVTLAVTKGMEKKAQALAGELKRHGFPVETLSLGEDASDFAHLQDCLMSWLETHKGENVVLNVTGGTKPMAIAAQEAFRMADKPVFYVDIYTDRVWWLGPGEEARKWTVREPLQHPMEVKTYLSLYGYQMLGQKEVYEYPEWLPMAETFARNALAWENAITCLNGIAQKCEKANSLYPDPKELQQKWKAWQDILKHLCRHRLLVPDAAKQKERFASVEARDFIKGGWLEAYLFTHIKAIYPNKGMTFMNAIVDPGKQPPNEIDVLTVVKSSLYFFECKTRDYTDKGSASGAIYKIDSLKEKIGGLRATGILVSYREPNEYDIRRAKGYGLGYIGPNDLAPARLTAKLRSLLHL